MKMPSSNPYLLTEKTFKAWNDAYNSQNSDPNPHFEKALNEAWSLGRTARLEDIKDIPSGMYCYSHDGTTGRTCPYWYFLLSEEGETRGCCSFLGIKDGDSGFDLLWDHIKSCGENDEWDFD